MYCRTAVLNISDDNDECKTCVILYFPENIQAKQILLLKWFFIRFWFMCTFQHSKFMALSHVHGISSGCVFVPHSIIGGDDKRQHKCAYKKCQQIKLKYISRAQNTAQRNTTCVYVCLAVYLSVCVHKFQNSEKKIQNSIHLPPVRWQRFELYICLFAAYCSNIYFTWKFYNCLLPEAFGFAILIFLNLSIERNEDVQADKNGYKNNKNCERMKSDHLNGGKNEILNKKIIK